jgi:hypothetical protein
MQVWQLYSLYDLLFLSDEVDPGLQNELDVSAKLSYTFFLHTHNVFVSLNCLLYVFPKHRVSSLQLDKPLSFLNTLCCEIFGSLFG